MSDSKTAHELPPGHAPGDHVPHVTPLKTYFATWIALMVLTVVTVGVSRLDFGAANFVIAMVVATIKALTVALMFMHLFHDHKFHAVIAGSAIIFLGIFVAFTMFDTEYRGRADAIEGERPADASNPFAGTRKDLLTKARWSRPAPGAAPAAAPAHH